MIWSAAPEAMVAVDTTTVTVAAARASSRLAADHGRSGSVVGALRLDELGHVRSLTFRGSAWRRSAGRRRCSSRV